MMSYSRRKDERGAVLAFTAVGILVLILIVALGIDYSYWLVHKRSLQHAAEAAALAGAAYMPDGTKAGAKALQVATLNGFTNGGNISVVGHAIPPSTYQVTITDNATPTFFSAPVLGGKITTSGNATASVGHPIDMGSPTNHIGTGNFYATGSHREGFFNHVYGPCNSAESGDQYNTKIDFADYLDAGGGGHPMWSCTPGPFAPGPGSWYNYAADSTHFPNAHYASGIQNNPYYTHGDGHTFIVDIPQTLTENWHLLIYGATGKDPSNGGGGSRATHNIGAPWTTDFTLYDSSGSASNPIGSTVKRTKSYAANASLSSPKTLFAPGIGTNTTWDDFYTFPAGTVAGSYALNMQTPQMMRGELSYSLLAESESALLGGSIQDCAGASCVHIYGFEHIVVDDQNVSGSPTFYVARVGKEWAGRSIELDAWDLADGMKNVKLLDPDLNVMGGAASNWTSKWGDGTKPNGDPCDSSCPPPAAGKLDIDVDFAQNPGLVPEASGGINNQGYNRHLLRFIFTVPTTYNPPDEDHSWVRVQLTPKSSGASDTSTWTIHAVGIPVRLNPQ
jgi:hypothetical protein